MKEFMYCFQIDKMTVFEVEFYTLSTNKTPYFSISAARFIRSKRDYKECGQVQERLLSSCSAARQFYDKWDHLHLHNLTQEEYTEIVTDIEDLKTRYNYIEDVRECFGQSAGCHKTHISFNEIVELSKPKFPVELYLGMAKDFKSLINTRHLVTFPLYKSIFSRYNYI